MSNHLQEVADYVMGDDTSELAKVKAELAYALMSLEREIAIAQSEQERSARLAKALEWYAKDYDHALGCSQWDGGARAREAINTDLIAPRHT